MKSHELANILELTSKLLRSLPNNDITHNINHIQKLVNNSAKQEIQKNRQYSINLPDDISDKLRTMSTQEIETYLNDDALFVSTASIQKLAEVVGIQTSKRQSRSALINLIVRHHEATQMDSIIRSGSKSEKETP
ncbi:MULTISPECIES: hypothetical protein [unclassified Pseudomonas]|uniref:hypothetical protein n=1 Tax=unclassified Pseudomonas TaxID=196821 RepID=UPI000C86AFB1|nr:MULTISPECIES: hypothetical protein [unclassified Pseudomonas]PMV21713.1 hypothetical protein C1X17_16665 [Pseudomonas sp. FW305-3-2-15-C-TSA2]PMV28399.1 hypothetical protein C1X22_14740 [Pseudomonas sp. DP16D-L5]PMV38796.1 hypothetical protein C1X21_13880 [Pseudomonas sp. FW305-3-2-15-A-LB2]PMV40102.1 hypothetical protein C1X16_26855 [Pseudomonas sp. FW305-3-2-15-C-R2A1]PMV51013.1 hypothetical protein C1X18_14320 [Pseudomonas sp. FW305-3-2-15-C-LB1]